MPAHFVQDVWRPAPKKPDAETFLTFNWSAWLQGSTIQTAELVYDAAQDLVVTEESTTASAHVLKLVGGTSTTHYPITSKVTASDGRIELMHAVQEVLDNAPSN